MVAVIRQSHDVHASMCEAVNHSVCLSSLGVEQGLWQGCVLAPRYVLVFFFAAVLLAIEEIYFLINHQSEAQTSWRAQTWCASNETTKKEGKRGKARVGNAGGQSGGIADAVYTWGMP